MSRKFDLPALLFFSALIFGAIVRFYPVFTSGFPLNDGGMFYTMTQDLKANNFSLPDSTTYNHADIPFAYPPLGFYVAALLSTLVPGSDLIIFRFLPAFINSLSIPAFYLFAKEFLGSRPLASAATLIYALLPHSFVWQVMGGGVTRSFGMLFLLLMLRQATLLFKKYELKYLLFAMLFGAGAVVSHPQTALHAALGGGLLFFFYGRNKRGLISAILFALGVALLSAPWWGTVLTRHGLEPFLSAGGTSPRSVDAYISLVRFESLEDYLAFPVVLLALVGVFFSKYRTIDKGFLATWAWLALVIDPRGAEGIALLAFTLLAGPGWIRLSAWLSHMDGNQTEAVMMKRSSLALLLGLFVFLLLGASVFDFQLVNTSLKAADLELIEWTQANLPERKTFALATGIEFSMSDPLQEWFPALTGQKSLTTMQGLEWTLGEKFFPWYDELIAFQHCEDAACVENWRTRNQVDYDYLIVLKPKDTEKSVLKNLGKSLRGAEGFALVHETEDAMIFEIKKRQSP